MLSVYLNASRDGKNRTHKAFSTAILLFLRVSKPIGLGFSGGGGVILATEKPGGVAGQRSYG
jgi:hypothetical protein